MTGQELLHRHFSAVARTYENHTAVVSPEGQITYGELEQAAENLAEDLTAAGVTCGSRVPICLAPGIDFIRTALAVLKAGGTYVPLDINDPADRTRSMADRLHASLAVTLSSETSRFNPALRTMYIDTYPETPLPSAETGPVVCLEVAPENHAYIIHTSGSTGTPKGIGISHDAVGNLLQAFNRIRPITPGDRCSLWSALNFDVSVYEIWSALMAGATLFIPEERLRFDPDLFLEWLAMEKITSAYIPPFMIERMATKDFGPRLKRMLTGVDPIPESLLCDIKQRIPGLTLINGYGPAEATVCATLYTVPDTPSRRGKAPIGKPVDNLDIILAGEDGQPVAQGEPGEIIISGCQVADGYINAPDRTAQAFTETDGVWYYKTGDMGYALENGDLVFMGRKDFQIKHRGVRIEPGEIESHLRAYPGVSQAAVVLVTPTTGPRQLTAFVDISVSAGEIMDFLNDRLPRTHLPAAVVPLDALPQTPQGKIDRAALRTMGEEMPTGLNTRDRSRDNRDTSAFADLDEPGTTVANIWENTLKTQLVTREDHFLLLGGDSISGARIISRIRDRLGKDIRLNTLFSHPRFDAFIKAVSGAPDLITDHSEDTDVSDDAPLPLLPDQEVIWIFEQVTPATSVYHIPLVYDIQGAIDPDRFHRAVSDTALRHPALTVSVPHENGKPSQVQEMADIRIETARGETTGIHSGMESTDPEIKSWLDERINAPFDIDQGPLFRTSLLRLSEERTLVCFVFHHLVFDGWSAALFAKSVTEAYNFPSGDVRSVPAETRTEYRHFIRQRLYEADAARERSREFYTTYLTGFDTQLPEDDTPVDFRADTIPVRLPVKQKLSALAGQLQVSPFTLLVGFFQIVLYLRYRQEDHITGIAWANRQGTRSENHIGFLMNTLLVRSRIKAGMDFNTVFEQVKQTLNNLYDNADVPFREVNRLYNEMSEQPLHLTSLFLMQTMDFPHLALSGTTSRFIHHKPSDTNVDITLELFETDEGYTGWLRYRTARLGRTEVSQMAEELETLVLRGISAPDRPITTADELQRFPLSPMQHGMLMETLRAPQGAGCYVEQIVFEMKQPIHVDRFNAAWKQVVNHHDVLRLGFAWQGLDHPEQFVTPPGPFTLEFNDWSNLAASEQNEFLDMFVKADRRLGFSLSNPPAFRVALFKRAANRYVCIWSFHHCIGDGRSMTFILRDLFRVYRNPDSPLPPSGSFRQYISWLDSHPKAPARTFWSDYLEGFTEPLVFPFRMNREDTAPGRRQQHAMPLTTGTHRAFLPAVTARKIKNLCSEKGLTMNTFLMGAWAVLLSHYTGKADILFGATVSVRNFDSRRQEAEGTEASRDTGDRTGMYINTLPVRIKINPALSFADFIADLRKQWKAIREHDQLSLTDIHALSPIRGSIPLSEIYFSYDYHSLDQSLAPYKSEVGCSSVSLLERTPVAIFLTVQGTDELEVTIEYDQRKFNEKTTRQILNHFANFLNVAADTPDALLTELPVLTPAEIQTIDQKLQTTRRHLNPTSSIHSLFEIQATVNTSVLAVTDGQKTLTYENLNRQANQVSHFLLAIGGGPGKRVLIFLPQTTDLIVFLLGILKSGACYIPTDISYPKKRLKYIIEDARPDLILTDAERLDLLPSTTADLVLVNREMETITRCADTNPQVPVAPGHTAYIIYTSGSTGTPKGVVVQHSALAAFTKSAATAYDLQPTDRVLQFASISFDASAEEIYPTLFSGACLVIKPRETVLTPEQFFAYCKDNAITVADLPTAYWHLIADQITELSLPDTLRLIIIGGEAARADKLEAWQQTVGDRIRLLNTYGPTETTVAVTMADLTSAQPVNNRTTIGRPFPGVSIAILNQFNQPAPPGVSGEIYIGGPQVSAGYLNLPELTARAFIYPGTDREDVCFFKTGDNAYMMPSGDIIFQGRIDRQIKINGYRVEPDEIEKTAMAHPGVETAAVTILKDRRDHIDVNLVVKLKENAADLPDGDSLKGWMADRLPAYMVPASIHFTDNFPLTSAGKIDYKKLNIIPTESRSLPATAIETTQKEPSGENQDETPPDAYVTGLMRIWQEILNRNDISITDNFFDIGGSSLTAIRLVTAVEKAFNITLPVLAIFRHPVLEDLAAVLREKDTGFIFRNLRVIKPKGDRPPIIFVAGTNEDTDAYAKQDLMGHPFFTLTVFAHKTVNNRIIPMDLWEIARRNVREITHAAPTGPYIIIGFCRYSIAAFEIASQLISTGKEVEHLVFLDEFWQTKRMSAFVGHHMKGMFRFGIGHILKKIIPKTREKLHMYSLALDDLRGRIYPRLGIPLPEKTQFRLMESAFWKAYKSYLPRPYKGDILVMDSKNWKEKYDPKLRAYAEGEVRRIPVDGTHRDWFKPAQIRQVLTALQPTNKGRPG
ncbi:MAG: amino acid adenylation domain-containing protein [Desulfobacterales bacterium]|nr:amino acid adenylation domain-containing protein [Desulfobacterales bacterium]